MKNEGVLVTYPMINFNIVKPGSFIAVRWNDGRDYSDKFYNGIITKVDPFRIDTILFDNMSMEQLEIPVTDITGNLVSFKIMDSFESEILEVNL